MVRPRCCRRVRSGPPCLMFKPAGVPASSLEEIVLGLDEMEAIRLADLLGMYQEEAAKQMNISRQTFGRIVEAARKKVAQALIEGQALRIEGGEVEMTPMRNFRCQNCEANWEVPFGTGRPRGCPKCKSLHISRLPQDKGPTHEGGVGQGRCHRGQRNCGSSEKQTDRR